MARISAKERRLAETLADPVLWGQGYLRNRDGGQRIYWPCLLYTSDAADE